jgi:hypothetical protein
MRLYLYWALSYARVYTRFYEAVQQQQQQHVYIYVITIVSRATMRMQLLYYIHKVARISVGLGRV